MAVLAAVSLATCSNGSAKTPDPAAGAPAQSTKLPEPSAPAVAPSPPAPAVPAAEPSSPPVAASAKTPALRSVVFVTTTGTVTPKYWRSEKLTIGSSLTTTLTNINYEATSSTDGKITQVQFDALAQALWAADVLHAKSRPRVPAPVGGGTNRLTVVTDRGTFVFDGPTRAEWPPGFQAIFELRNQLRPASK